MKNLFSELFLSGGVNYFTDDRPLQEMLKFFSFRETGDIRKLGGYVSGELIELLDFIDHEGKPRLHTWGILGNRIDYVRLAPEHRRALLKLQELGIISSMFKGDGSLLQHFVSGYVVSDSGIFCTLTLTAQTAYALGKYANKEISEKYLPKFLQPENPWFGATFYTETHGGSDLGANKTAATYGDGKYLISGGDKYFASDAGVADGAIVTARKKDSPPGAKGISVFFVPAYREDGSLNYTIRRLKDKLGTVAVPTGEVEFENSEGFELGDTREGIYIAMEILTISRIDDAIAAVGIARKALWEAYRYSERRIAFGRTLLEHPLMLKDLMEMETELEAATALSILSASLFDEIRNSRPPYGASYHLSRAMSSIAKNMASAASAEITRYSMEILGGTGFLEEFPMAKFHRDSIVTSIWEGTTNIQALEFLEVLTKKDGVGIITSFLENETLKIENEAVRSRLMEELERLKERTRMALSSGEAEFRSKDLLTSYGRFVSSLYLYRVSQSTEDSASLTGKAAKIYFMRYFGSKDYSYRELLESSGLIEWMGLNKVHD